MRRLDIDPEEVKALPQITDSLASCFGTKPEQLPRQKIINYLSASSWPVAHRFLESWRSIKECDLKSLPIEAVCVIASVSPLELFGAIFEAAKSMKSQESALKAILAHPDVIDATVESAKLPGPLGHADRKLLHQAVGFLPTTKGGGVEINFFGRPKDQDEESTDADNAWDETFPDMGTEIAQWSEKRHALTDGKE